MEFSITVLDKNYTSKSFVQATKEELPKWAYAAHDFIINWHQGNKDFLQKTSGSTGKAKEIYISKEAMVASAKNTIEALKIPDGAKVLHCINAEFIGGKMLIVRALLGHWQLHLVKPKGSYKANELWEKYDFSAMVPLQVNELIDSKSGIQTLNSVNQIIIGGATVTDALLQKLQKLVCTCFSTFGMTETVSHIALKQLNGKEKSDYFKVIGDNQISINNDGCLMVRGKVTHDEWIQTNDLIETNSEGFKWLARFDLVVNTGGIKVLIEPTEKLISEQLNAENHHFLLWKKQDEKLGEKLIGLSDSKIFISYLEQNYAEIKAKLPQYHFPKEWHLVNDFLLTKSGKLDRVKTAQTSIASFSFE